MRRFEGYEKGINLGGWFSQCVHTREHYDSFIKDEDFKKIASWGADHVRVPVDYELIEDALGEPVEEGYERLEKTVALCRENGLKMVLDLHKAAGYSFDPGEGETGFFDSSALQERFMKLWERIAERFGKDHDMLAFELLNEVTEKEYRDTWNRIATECIGRIRKAAPDSYIIVGGYYYNSAVAVKDIDVPFDERIVYNFHCYEPLVFTHQGAPWIPTMDPEFRVPVGLPFGELFEEAKRMGAESCAALDKQPPEGRLSADYFKAFMREAVETAEKKGVPLYCGEYGVIDRAKPEYALEWFKMINAAFTEYGIGRAAWSFRRMDFGIEDARMDGVREKLLKYI